MMNTTTATLSADEQAIENEKTMFGHPRGLYICFATELWERFSFYGLKYLLLLYLTKYHLFTDTGSLSILGSYMGLVYALPVLGGILADRYLGMRKAVLFGGILLCFGHLGMAVEGHKATEYDKGSVHRFEITLTEGSIFTPGTKMTFDAALNGISYKEGDTIQEEITLQHNVIVPANTSLPTKGVVQDGGALQFFYFSLALIVIGVGFLKPNISTIVGRLYPADDPRRDSGFTIFYMGINTGSFLATALCGWLGENFGWSYGFGAAGIGMVFGLITFLYGQKYLHGHAEPKDPEKLKEKIGFGLLNREQLIYAGSLLALVVIWQLIQNNALVHDVLNLLILVVLIGILIFMFTRCNNIERSQMSVLLILMSFTVVFWTLFEQSAGSMTFYADRVLDRSVFGIFEPTASQLGSLNALFIILTAPFFAWLWATLTTKNKNPSTPTKFALGIIQAGLGFYMLVLGAAFPDESGKVALIWMVLATLFHTTGEMCLSPVGLSAVTKLSVPRVVGLMMGIWFLATALAELLATEVSKYASMATTEGKITDVALALATYTDLYTALTYVGIGFGLLLLLITPVLKKYMHGQN